MTGLLSRTGFDARLAEVLVGVGRGAGRIALLVIDLDRFKAVNDEYGHGTGDRSSARSERDCRRLSG